MHVIVRKIVETVMGRAANISRVRRAAHRRCWPNGPFLAKFVLCTQNRAIFWYFSSKPL